MSSSTGTAGEPKWVTGDAPNLAATFNELSEFALKRGGLLRGTTAERNAFQTAGYAKPGDYWHDTTLDRLFKYTSSGWVNAQPVVSVGAVTAAANWDTSGVQLLRQDDRVTVVGEFKRTAAVTISGSPWVAVGVASNGFAPTSDYRLNASINAAGQIDLVILENRTIQVRAMGSSISTVSGTVVSASGSMYMAAS